MNSAIHSSVNSSVTSFIYLYSKFTEEFLLLGAAAIFSLLAVYCYHWVIKKRRLGAARNQIPAGMVKVYLNQLIGEAQFVRTQLFGLLGNDENSDNSAQFQKLFAGHPGGSAAENSNETGGDGTSIPSDLSERLKALESQLTEKESMVVNINIEKKKLLDEVENLRNNAKSASGSAAAGNNDSLLSKIKSLEERLEEYALFEDDLANLKRLQQENSQLRKRLEDMGGSAPAPVAATPAPALSVVAPAPEVNEPKIEVTAVASTPITKDPSIGLDQHAIDSLLEGVTPVAPVAVTGKQVTAEPVATVDPAAEKAPITAAAAVDAIVDAKVDAPVEAAKAPAATDDFEKLVDSVETSLDAVVAAPKDEALANKTDEELLKEFENLLNS